ncbi:common central domain of tyrosinase-domain-containing protein [Podospora didyma]|uniref:tyrosinase n=1 Tax=Podospora didyma TaxID=330526 RepID=A0AAE0NPJ5_9PEZI|nr:common central domain of tyrosinase-domain-containing protein [Podospora didyma]
MPAERTDYYAIIGLQDGLYPRPDQPLRKVPLRIELDAYILFATWHRPYLLLFEQILFEMMTVEAQSFYEDERPALLKDLKTWRLSYWDWAQKKPQLVNGEPVLDEDGKPVRKYNVAAVFYQQKVMIKRRGGEVRPYRHALYKFNMPNGWTMGDSENLGDLHVSAGQTTVKDDKGVNAMYKIPYDECRSTSRHSTGQFHWALGEANPKSVAAGLEVATHDQDDGNTSASLREAFYRILQVKTWEEFATKCATLPGPGNKNPRGQWSSSEAIHDTIHGWVGGNATIDETQNVAFMGHMPSVPEGEYWTSESCREVTNLGYTYRDLEKWLYVKTDGSYDKEAHIAALNVKINDAYHASRAAALKSDMTEKLDNVRLASIPELIEQGGEVRYLISWGDYAVNIIYEKFAFEGSPFRIYIFVGKVPDEIPYIYQAVETSLVGEIYNFSSRSAEFGSNPAGCGNYRQDQGVRVLRLRACLRGDCWSTQRRRV